MIQVISNMPVGTIGLRVGHEPGPVRADTKMWFKNPRGMGAPRHRSDVDRLKNAVTAFGWLMPGDVKVFEFEYVRDAKQWLVGLDDD
jgi:hypothetical protein